MNGQQRQYMPAHHYLSNMEAYENKSVYFIRINDCINGSWTLVCSRIACYFKNDTKPK